MPCAYGNLHCLVVVVIIYEFNLHSMQESLLIPFIMVAMYIIISWLKMLRAPNSLEDLVNRDVCTVSLNFMYFQLFSWHCANFIIWPQCTPNNLERLVNRDLCTVFPSVSCTVDSFPDIVPIIFCMYDHNTIRLLVCQIAYRQFMPWLFINSSWLSVAALCM